MQEEAFGGTETQLASIKLIIGDEMKRQEYKWKTPISEITKKQRMTAMEIAQSEHILLKYSIIRGIGGLQMSTKQNWELFKQVWNHFV